MCDGVNGSYGRCTNPEGATMNGQHGDTYNLLALVRYLDERDDGRERDGSRDDVRRTQVGWAAILPGITVSVGDVWRRLRGRTVGSA